MNCEEFHNALYDLLDESLPVEGQTAAQEHAGRCARCGGALAREEAVARVLHQRLQGATAGLSFDPNAKRRIFDRRETGRIAAGHWFSVWRWTRGLPLAPLGLCALVLAGLLLARVWPRSGGSEAITGKTTWAVDVPLFLEAHEFQLQNGAVKDSLVTSAALARADFSEEVQRNAKR